MLQSEPPRLAPYPQAVDGPRNHVKPRAKRCVLARKDTKDGPLEVITPKESSWYQYYVVNYLMYGAASSMLTSSSMPKKKFRNSFWLPYPSFLSMVKQLKSDDRFECWCGFKKFHKPSLPIELFILGLLRYLGCGWTLEDIKDNTAILQEVHYKFLHAFMQFGSAVLHAKFVLTPVYLDEAQSNMDE